MASPTQWQGRGSKQRPAMQKLAILFGLVLTFLPGRAQSVQKITAADFVQFANNQLPFSEWKTSQWHIRIYRVSGGVSRYAVDTDEVDDFLYVAVSAYGEQSVKSLVKAGPFFTPAFFNWTTDKKTGNALLAFSYHTTKKRRGVLSINLTSVTFSSI